MAATRKTSASKPKTMKTLTLVPQAGVLSGQNIQDSIRNRAYELFLQRGGQHGHELEDWLRAETEVITQFKRHSA